MFYLLLLSFLPFLSPQDETEGPNPQDAVAAIKEALKGDDAAVAASTLKNSGTIADKTVVKATLGGFSHKEPSVRLEALRALRFNEDRSAFTELLKISRNKKLMDDEKFAAEYYLSLGQKGDPKAIKTITKGMVVESERSMEVRARIGALGNIRDRRSVEELMAFFVQGRGRARHPYTRDISVSLVVLTGEQYANRDQWLKWWGDNKRSFKIEDEPGELPKQYQRKWDAMWEHPDDVKERLGNRREGKGKNKDGEADDGGKEKDTGEKDG